MKLFAQIGHGLGEKVLMGLTEKSIDGAIFSPKDLKRDTMINRISDVRHSYPNAEILVDPQFYVCLFSNSPAINVGSISDWSCFRIFRKGELERSQTVDRILGEYFREIADVEVTSVVAPNIYITQSFDSREAVIAKNFVRQTRDIYDKTGDKRPLFASLVISREALQDRREFEDFINDITMLETRPDGFYLIIGGRSSDASTDIYHTDVIANWMLINFSLSINGFQVINGYSDLLTPFLGVAGGVAGATGWYSNLRMFSIDRFFPSVGGRLPLIRYLSRLLLNRITISEKEALTAFIPGILNELPHDQEYNPEPERSREVLQAWEALKSLNRELIDKNAAKGIEKCLQAISRAEQAYSEIAALGIVLDQKSRDEHVLPLLDGLREFMERAEL
jgi:hypothetical protein